MLNELGTSKYQGLACPHGFPGLMTTRPRTVLPSLSACMQTLWLASPLQLLPTESAC